MRRYSLFGGSREERDRLIAGLTGFEALLGQGKVDFGILLVGDDGPSRVDVRARLAELAGAPLFVVGPNRLDFAVRAGKLGATDYVAAPLTSEALGARLLDQAGIVTPQAPARGVGALIGMSASMAKVRAHIELYGAGTEPVLVLGESGTGKELVARALHLSSPRKDKALHAINCSTLVDSLAESELFGARRGAFTGAAADRPGLFAAAHMSTLFLDEVGTASAALQAKLLRVLESGEFLQLGSTTPTRVDVRIVAATNADLRNKGQFRDDLYFRLAGAVITLPPLRERLEDLPLLVAHISTTLAQRLRRTPPRFDPEVFERLRAHAWPGNVRELVHTLANAMTLAGGDVVHVGDLPPLKSDGNALADYDSAKQTFERDYVEKLMRLTGGNVSEASRIAGRTRKDMYKLFERAGLDPALFRPG